MGHMMILLVIAYFTRSALVKDAINQSVFGKDNGQKFRGSSI